MVLDDNQKIGIGLICLGLGFVILGIIMLFDTSLIAIGNSLFIIGLLVTIGLQRSWTLFSRYSYIEFCGIICKNVLVKTIACGISLVVASL